MYKMEVERFIFDLLKNFNGTYKEFFAYTYKVFSKKIDSIDKKDSKDKYLKIKKSILNYIIVNKKVISKELSRKKI